MNDSKNDGKRPWWSRWAITLLVTLIRWYQVILSPLIGPSCRFSPTCSHYAVLAIRQYGAVAGSIKAVRRILRCHPWNPGGYDPP